MSATLLATSNWRPGLLPLELLENRPHFDDESHFRWQHSTGIVVRLPGGWTLAERTVIDSDRTLDVTNRAKEYRQLDASVDVPTALLRYEKGPFCFQVGRDWRRWGPGWTGSLILSELHPPTDGLDVSYTRDRWSARFSFQRLDNLLVEDPAEVAVPELSRFLSAHRLDVCLIQNLRVGVTETAVTASDGAPPFWAFNPLLPWALVQQERDPVEEVANVLWSCDAIWNPRPAWALYGQFLLDDFMLDSADQDSFPDQLGWLAGVLWQSGSAGERPGAWKANGANGTSRAAGPAWSAGLEYSRLSSWTYVHRNPAGRYRAWGASLGHPAGPDSETLTGFLELNEGRSNRCWLLLARWQRHGRIDVNTPETSTGQTGESFPTPPVTTRWHLAAVATVPGPLGTLLEGRIGWTDVSISDGDPSDPDAAAGINAYTALAVTIPLWTWEFSDF